MIARQHRIEAIDAGAPDSAHHAIAALLRRGVGEIDRTFADVGSRFGEGLALFEELKGKLLGVSQELTDPAMLEARQQLEALAMELPKLGARLVHEKAALANLHLRSASVGKVVAALRSRMRLVEILTQRARIERASALSNAKDLEAFMDEMAVLSKSARQAVEDCAARHGEVMRLIQMAVQVQEHFEDQFAGSLTDLAEKLTATLAELGTRQTRSIAAINGMVDHSVQVVAATGNTVMALQSGDSIRQRMEHAIAALKLADSPISGARTAIFMLQSAQLHDTAKVLTTDCRDISDSIRFLGEKTGRLVNVVHDMLGGSMAQNESSIVAELEAGLATAARLFKTCEDGRRTVDKTLSQLMHFFEGFATTVGTLRQKAEDIVFIGINTGLRATHAGEGGRSLHVIAKELKIAADLVERDASELGNIFALMLTASADLQRQMMDSGSIASFETTIRQSLRVIGQSGERLANLLKQLDQAVSHFSSEISSAHNAFATISNSGQEIEIAANRLAEMAACEPEAINAGQATELTAFLNNQIFKSYTMVAERDIHRTVLARLGITAPAAAKIENTPRPSADDIFEEFAL